MRIRVEYGKVVGLFSNLIYLVYSLLEEDRVEVWKVENEGRFLRYLGFGRVVLFRLFFFIFF